jgi:hypothetical protein
VKVRMLVCEREKVCVVCVVCVCVCVCVCPTPYTLHALRERAVCQLGAK